MDMTALFFPQNNDIVVTAKFPEITDGTGIVTEFWYKDNRFTADSDPSSTSYQAEMIQGDDSVWYSEFDIPAADNLVTGAFWWRVDAIDAQNKRMTASAGTLLIEAV